MKKIKWHLLLIAAVGIGAAYTTRPNPSPTTLHTYAFAFYSTDHTRIYYSMDLTNAGYVKGIDYDCEAPTNVCTFIGDPSREQSDGTGTYFFTSQIPNSGLDNSGSFVNLD
jgi:hypothetical protein